jgi:hypothetical protein
MLLPPPGRRPARETPPPAKRAALQVIAKPAPAPTERHVTKLEEIAFAAVESEVGGRAAFVELLAVTQHGQKEDMLLASLADPANDRVALARLCHQLKIDKAGLYEKITAASMARGKARASLKVAEKLPQVALGVMEDAIPGNRACRACQGLGLVAGDPTPDGPPAEVTCTVCRGTGQTYFVPETPVRELALKMGKMVEKASGTHISVLQQNAQMSGMVQADTYDRLVGALDTALYGSGRDRLSKMQTSNADGVVEGEVTGE